MYTTTVYRYIQIIQNTGIYSPYIRTEMKYRMCIPVENAHLISHMCVEVWIQHLYDFERIPCTDLKHLIFNLTFDLLSKFQFNSNPILFLLFWGTWTNGSNNFSNSQETPPPSSNNHRSTTSTHEHIMLTLLDNSVLKISSNIQSIY